MANSDSDNKMTGIITLCITIIILGFFLLLFKTEACKKSPDTVEDCKEEFVEVKLDSKYDTSHKCTPGATIEIVTSPPAPKSGIICRCNVKNSAPATSVDR